EVRLMVAHGTASDLVHTRFLELPAFLEGGDLIVVNASATIPAAISASGTDGARLLVHLSTHLDDGSWVVEPRRRGARGTERWSATPPPRTLSLDDGATIELLEHYRGDRLWRARLELPQA